MKGRNVRNMTNFVQKRKKTISVCVILGILIISFLGAFAYKFWVSNSLDEKGNVDQPSFSLESGFYSSDQELTLTAKAGTRIFYTLDGSEPDEDDILYEHPVHLSNATNKENVYSMNTDVSTGFYKELIDKYPKFYDTDVAPGYKAPDYLVDKCNVVRAVAIDRMGRKSEVVTKSYFVGIDADRYQGCNIVSMVTDPENLFSDEKGIYVTGNTFQEYLKSDEIGKGYNGQRWKMWKANYRNRGNDWEREVEFTLFDENGELSLRKTLGVRIAGRSSRGIVPKSLKFYAKEKYDGTDSIDYDFFEDGQTLDCFTLSGGGTKPITQFTDYAMAQRTEGLNFATMKFSPCVLFIDGEYWGFYWLTSRYDARYLSETYGVDESNVMIMKEDEVVAGSKDAKVIYDEMVDKITSKNMKKEKNYEKACELIDMDSYIDYYAAQIYIGRCGDWPRYNYALWRTIDKKDDKYSDGKWRWMLYDSNSYAMTRDLINDNTLEYVIDMDDMFASLWENKNFRKEFRKRILEIAEERFDSKEMAEFIENFREEMYPRMSASWARFYGKDNEKGEAFQNSVDGYKEFFNHRKKVVESWFQ